MENNIETLPELLNRYTQEDPNDITTFVITRESVYALIHSSAANSEFLPVPDVYSTGDYAVCIYGFKDSLEKLRDWTQSGADPKTLVKFIRATPELLSSEVSVLALDRTTGSCVCFLDGKAMTINMNALDEARYITFEDDFNSVVVAKAPSAVDDIFKALMLDVSKNHPTGDYKILYSGPQCETPQAVYAIKNGTVIETGIIPAPSLELAH